MALRVSLEVVADPSRSVTVAATDTAERLGIRRIAGGMRASAAYRDSVRAELIALAGAGELEVPIAGVFPLERLHDALRVLMTGHPGGKLALAP
ncbi:zinc-binding dehydrogenase [Microbacterium sp. NPDC058021]|uniref:zinc-binding dehydrogenase n=1 Tax=Microbacterium sp. NPDC058021 TaxID=3346306 RepID=UPI0036D970A2